MARRIMMTGGAGFVAAHVIRLLMEENHSIVIFDDFSNGKMSRLNGYMGNPLVEIVTGDVTDRRQVREAAKGCDTVIHLSVLDLRQSIKDPFRVTDVIVKGTLNILEAAVENKANLFINFSSTEVYGSALRVPMDETHPLCPTNAYAASKVAQDMLVHSYGVMYGLPWITIRPSNMYGPYSYWQGVRAELIPKMIIRAMNKMPLVLFGDGSQTRDFTYVEDTAQVLLKVMGNDHCRNRVYNTCSGHETSVRQIALLICKSFGLDPDRYIVTDTARPGEVQRHKLDNSRLKEAIGYAPETRIEQGLSSTIAWFESLPYSPEELVRQEKTRNWE